MTALSEQIRLLPKVDLHVHLEGTITPDMAKKMAARNGVTPKPSLMNARGDSFQWESDGTGAGSLKGFIQAYDDAAAVMKQARDYTDITYDYLKRAAEEGCIYAEIGISADHGAMVGLTYPEMLEAIAEGYGKAKAETGIEMRLISTCVRHYGPEAALKVAKITHDNPHPLVTGFGMAGDENAYTIEDFVPAFEASGLKNRTAHAGEASGAQTVRDARELLHIRRFGHMVRAIEDAAVMAEQVEIKAVPEVCVSSNLFLKVFPDYASHPLRRFFDAGLKVTLGSDDPTFFDTSIGREYEIAHRHFGFTERELLKLSQNAVEEAFVDEETRTRLMERLEGYAIAA
jgi:adenosine deaminase